MSFPTAAAIPGACASAPLRERVVLFSCLLYIVTSLVTGPLRWGLGKGALAPLIYIPNLMLITSLGWQFIAEAATGFTPLRLIGVVVVVHATIVGFLFLLPVQVAFGLFTLLPFWFGLICGGLMLRSIEEIRRVAPWLWCVAVAGVLINAAIDLPWEGFEYSVGNIDIEASREWSETGGGKRLAGLARSSFDAAIQIQLLGLLAVLSARRLLVRLSVWGLSAVAIWLTTSKGVLNVYAVLTPIIGLRTLLPQFPLRLLPLVFGLVALALPISTLFYTFNSNVQDATLANILFSFYDRLNSMWPQAWELLLRHGSALFGRGIGGVGTPQNYFEADRFNAGDNLFMYWFVIFGWIALPGFLLLLARSLRLQPFRSTGELTVYCLILATVVYGMTANVVENAMFAIACGIGVRYLASPIDMSRRSHASA